LRLGTSDGRRPTIAADDGVDDDDDGVDNDFDGDRGGTDDRNGGGFDGCSTRVGIVVYREKQ
jgi:hypothetical protein